MEELKNSEYFKRGRHNPFDSYINGFSFWLSPRQILILENKLKCNKEPETEVDKEAYNDFLSQLENEAKIKKKKYLT